jgi:hypothetical protein
MCRCSVCGAFFIGLILTGAAAGMAQDDNRSEPSRPPFYSLAPSKLTWLLTKPGVQKELGLDESESRKLLASLREIDPTNYALRTPEERKKQVARVHAVFDATKQKSEEAIQKSLSEAQFQRFQQLQLQRLGGRALVFRDTAHKLAETLALTAEQQAKLKTISQEFSSTKPQAITEKFKSDLLAVLTPEQMNQWKAMMGAPFTIPKSFRSVPWQLIFVPEVHKEMGLSEDEAARLVRLLEAVRKEVIEEKGQEEFDFNLAGPPPADRDRSAQQIIDAARSALTVSQWNRLQELLLQDAGLESLAHPEVAIKLGLSRQQRDRVRESIAEYLRGFTGDRTLAATPNELQSRRDKVQADLLDILTPDQKTQWETMQGSKVDPDLFRSPAIRPAGK